MERERERKREREREREGDRQTDRETDRPTDRQRRRKRQTDRQTDTETDRERQADRQRETDRQTHRQSERDRQTGTQTDRKTDRKVLMETDRQTKVEDIDRNTVHNGKQAERHTRAKSTDMQRGGGGFHIGICPGLKVSRFVASPTLPQTTERITCVTNDNKTWNLVTIDGHPRQIITVHS